MGDNARLDSHYKQTLEEVLSGYTKDAAYTEFQEAKKGLLKEGMLADMVLLSADVYATEIVELKDLATELTLMNGNIIYQR